MSDLEAFYDDETWEAIEGWRPTGGRGEPQRGHRTAAAGVVAAAMFTGVRDTLDPEPEEPQVEFELFRHDHTLRRVVYHHVPGNPRASTALIRTWLH